MATGATSGTVSGAAQGAVAGFQFGGPWGALAGGVIGGVGGFISGSSADAQQETQNAWAQYNNAMQYQTALYNIDTGLTIAEFNARATMAAAAVQSGAAKAAAEYNAGMIYATTSYNALLQEQELSRVWEDEGLALEQLGAARARERGGIVATQGASGTVIGEGSNEDVVVGQMTQEAMDSTIIQHGAQRQAAEIANQMSQGLWQGQVAIQQTMWEGEMQGYMAQANAGIQAAGTMATARLNANADRWSARVSYDAGNNNIAIGDSKYSAQQTQNMVTGLFNAGASAATMYGMNKAIQPAQKYASKSATAATSHRYMGNNSYTASKSGSSLMTDLMGPF